MKDQNNGLLNPLNIFDIDILNTTINMRALSQIVSRGFATRRLGVADASKVIQEKIMNITQVVRIMPNLERRQGIWYSHQYR